MRHENPGKAFSGQTDSTKTGANSIRTRTFGAVSEALGLSILGTIDQVTNAQGGLVVSAQSHSSIASHVGDQHPLFQSGLSLAHLAGRQAGFPRKKMIEWAHKMCSGKQK